MEKLNGKVVKLLRWSEKYTKTDMVYLAGNGSWLFIGQAIIFVLSFALAWTFANLLDKSDYGNYKFVLSLATLASLSTLTGMGVAIARRTVQGQYILPTEILRKRMLYGLLGVLVLVSGAIYYWVKDNHLLATLLLAASVWIPIMDPLSDFQYYLQGKKDFYRQALYRILQRLFLTFVVILTILLTKNIVIITIVYFAVTTLVNYLAYKRTNSVYPPHGNVEVDYKALFNYGKKLSIMNIFSVAAAHVDKILLFHFVGSAQLAIYFFAISLPQEIQGALGNIHAVAFPKLVSKKSSIFRKLLLKKIFKYILILMLPTALYIFAAPFLFSLFFPAYLDSVFYSQLFAVTILFAPFSVIWQYFLAQENKLPLYVANFGGPSIFLLSLLILLPAYGILGAIISAYIRLSFDAAAALWFLLSKTSNLP